MIKKFNEYNINEMSRNDLLSYALAFTLIFSTIKNDSHKQYDLEFFERYVKSMNIANKNQLVQEVIRDFKQKVLTDPKILNKREVYNVIDNTPIVYRNNDDICEILYQIAKGDGKALPSSWCTTILPEGQKDKKGGRSIIFLNKEASYYEIYHELSRAIESVVVIDPKIVELFNFNHDFKKQNLLLSMITNSEYSKKSPYSQERIKYLNDPSEIFSRLNSFKIFLFKNKILKSPNEEITDLLLLEIYTGKLYYSLSEKAKIEFANSDFMEILIFVDFEKFHKINQYVNQIKKSKNIT